MGKGIYEIGRRYEVPCVQVTQYLSWSSIGSWVPVLLPKHNDKETINFPHEHYHIDWRFASSSQWRHADDRRLGSAGAFAIVLSDNLPAKYIPYRDEIVYKRLLCKRDFPIWPHEHTPWMKQLQKEYADKKVTACGKCPHRGVDLSNVEAKILDLGKPTMKCIRICPGHGLVWSNGGENVNYQELYEK